MHPRAELSFESMSDQVMTGIVRFELPPKGALGTAKGLPLPPGTTLPVHVVQSDLQGTPDNIRRHTRKRTVLPSPSSSSSALGSSDMSFQRGKVENNLEKQQEGTYLIALGSARKSPFNLPQFLAPYPTLRMIASLLSLEATTALIPKVCGINLFFSQPLSICLPSLFTLLFMALLDGLLHHLFRRG